LRLDDDSIFRCEFDIFERFIKSNKTYGFYRFTYDPKEVTEGLRVFIDDYVQKENITHFIPEIVDWHYHAIDAMPLYYNNFELVRYI
jgi:hypothetical protein